MADGFGKVTQVINEFFVKPVVNEIIPASTPTDQPQSQPIAADGSTPPQKTPEEIKAEEEKKKADALWVINQGNKLEEELKKVREANAKKEQERLTVQAQETQVEEVKKEEKQSAAQLALERMQKGREQRSGGGVGG